MIHFHSQSTIWFIFDNIYRAGDYRSRRIGAQQTLSRPNLKTTNKSTACFISRPNRLDYYYYIIYIRRRLKVNCAVTSNAIEILLFYFLNRARGYLNAFVGVFRAWRINAAETTTVHFDSCCSARKGKVNTQLSVNQTSNLAVLISSAIAGQLFSLSRFKKENIILNLNHEKDNEYYSLISLMRKSLPPPHLWLLKWMKSENEKKWKVDVT